MSRIIRESKASVKRLRSAKLAQPAIMSASVAHDIYRQTEQKCSALYIPGERSAAWQVACVLATKAWHDWIEAIERERKSA